MRLLWGEVLNVDDEETRGRIQVSVPNLGRVTQDKAIYAYPIDVHALRVPRVGDRVMLMFVAGRPSQAIYLGQARWLDESPPSTYEGPDTVVLYEDPDGGLSVMFDVASGTLNIKDGHGNTITLESGLVKIDSSGDIELNGNSKSFVTHAELNTAIQTFINALNLHTHPTAATGPASPPTAPMSLNITSAETLTIKTGG